jgi:hypothetical protein
MGRTEPWFAETLKCMHPNSLADDQLEAVWKRYLVLHSTSVLRACPHDVRVVIVFTSSAGTERWVALGRGTAKPSGPLDGGGEAYLETEGHVCHPLDGPLFRQIVDLLHIRNDAVTDREYRKYL